MYDINFYMKSFKLFEDIKSKTVSLNKQELFEELDRLRSKEPTVYNIETTNNCLHMCQFCPRTTKMTRQIKTMNINDFENIVSQIKPWKSEEWNLWELFVEKEYSIKKNDMSENHFFLYIIPNVIQLHCYGDDLLNKNIGKFVGALAKKGIKSYFSTNSTNINLDKIKECLDNGLSYIKFSIESTNNELHQKLRGIRDYDFQKSYKDINELLEYKKQKKLNTTIVITMLDFNSNAEEQEKEFEQLKKYFDEKDYYVYKKSLDTQWYTKNYHPNKSIHWNSICKHPWFSMTILSNCQSAECMESYNGDVNLGNTKSQSLYDIWNGEKYKQFRKDHFDLNPNIRCFKECDMKMIGECL